MVINLNLLASIAGCVLCLLIAAFYRRGYLIALCGCVAIVLAYFYAARMFALLEIIFAVCIGCAILAAIAGVTHASHRKIHSYIPPEQRRMPRKPTTTRQPVQRLGSVHQARRPIAQLYDE